MKKVTDRIAAEGYVAARVAELAAQGLSGEACAFDAIVAQASHPWTAGASHLYTREFFDYRKGEVSARIRAYVPKEP